MGGVVGSIIGSIIVTDGGNNVHLTARGLLVVTNSTYVQSNSQGMADITLGVCGR